MLKTGTYIRTCVECKFFLRYPTKGYKGKCLTKRFEIDTEIIDMASNCTDWEVAELPKDV